MTTTYEIKYILADYRPTESVGVVGGIGWIAGFDTGTILEIWQKSGTSHTEWTKLMEIPSPTGEATILDIINMMRQAITSQYTKLDDLEDVNITTVIDGDVLKYDGVTETWIPSVNTLGNRSYTNPNPILLEHGRAVTKLGIGTIGYGSYNSDDLSKLAGILLSSINQTESSFVQSVGWVKPSIFNIDCFTEGTFPTEKSRLWLMDNGKFSITPPAIGSGKKRIAMGTWNDGGLQLNIQDYGS